MLIADLVADANVLLSAVAGKAALRVFTQYRVRVHTTRFNAEEVTGYIPLFAQKYGLSREQVELQWRLLPLVVHPPDSYNGCFSWAAEVLSDRDPDDAHPLALARTLDLPIWSNDRDLQNHGIPCYPTAELLKILDS
jgi:predicted nucleic acid-binding protein